MPARTSAILNRRAHPWGAWTRVGVGGGGGAGWGQDGGKIWWGRVCASVEGGGALVLDDGWGGWGASLSWAAPAWLGYSGIGWGGTWTLRRAM